MSQTRARRQMARKARTQRAVFVDRDGCVISDENFLCDPARVRVLPGVTQAIRDLHDAGYLVIVVTNQSAVARGMLTEKLLEQIHERLQAELAQEDARLDAIYYCPHLAEGKVKAYAKECECRKPEPGMILRAAREHKINLADSYMVGDAERDVEAGLAAGCHAILISANAEASTKAEAVRANLAAAAELILSKQA